MATASATELADFQSAGQTLDGQGTDPNRCFALNLSHMFYDSLISRSLPDFPLLLETGQDMCT